MRRGERGANLVELAIVTPLLLLLLAGTVDLGRMWYSWIVVTNAVGEGARYGARQPDNFAGIRTKVTDEIANSGAAAALIGACDVPDPEFANISPSGISPSRMITVRASCEFDLLIPLIEEIVAADGITISNFARARVQGWTP
ncbi:MAG: pilus assembly protein [Anaerolineae bacterium]|jgi:hypothetical protein|nr:pilus assembly protein [Anaerolineae bacterium]